MAQAKAKPTPWRGEYENERTFEYIRLKLIHLKLWGVIGRTPALTRCAVTEEKALHVLDETVAAIAGLDAQTPPASKRRWKKTMVAELTRLLREAQAVVEGRRPIGLVKSADEMVNLIVESRRKQGATDNALPTPVLRNIARLIGAGGVCGLEDLVVDTYQKKYGLFLVCGRQTTRSVGQSNGRFSASVKKLSDSWPACVHCCAPVDDKASPPIHYWTEERDCRDNRGRKLGTFAKPGPLGRSSGSGASAGPTMTKPEEKLMLRLAAKSAQKKMGRAQHAELPLGTRNLISIAEGLNVKGWASITFHVHEDSRRHFGAPASASISPAGLAALNQHLGLVPR